MFCKLCELIRVLRCGASLLMFWGSYIDCVLLIFLLCTRIGHYSVHVFFGYDFVLIQAILTVLYHMTLDMHIQYVIYIINCDI